jgi:hypothetical protein
VHVPSLPETLHASQEPVHELLQQYPSAQLPDAHSPLLTHVVPLNLRHVPFVRVVALHDAPAPHGPVAQQTPSVQYPLGHAEASVHAAPRPSIGTQKPALQ